MRAMVLEKPHEKLKIKELPIPKPEREQILVHVTVCAVCRTDLHILDGELLAPHFPLILGHQIVGKVAAVGPDVQTLKVGDRIGVPWLGKSCGHCSFCQSKRENLCDGAKYMGYQMSGGFAEYCLAYEPFCLKLPSHYRDEEAAPLLCAGLIGYRALKMTKDAEIIGFYGFGASAHLLIQVASSMGKKVAAFTRKGDKEGQVFAKKLGAVWAGDSEEKAPFELDAAIIFAPVGALVPTALSALKKGGSVICAGIHMSDIPSFPYALLWGERSVRSVANLTRQDGEEFMQIASKVPIKATTTLYPLEKANEALNDLRLGRLVGSALLVIS